MSAIENNHQFHAINNIKGEQQQIVPLANDNLNQLSLSHPDIMFMSILNKSQHQCTASLLKVGDLTILLDCGANESYSLDQLNLLRDIIKEQNVDFIFLSHASMMHVGAIPYLQANGCLDFQLKVMSTSPTAKMGALTMYEFFIQKKESANFDYFTLQDVEKSFERIELVSYNENRKIRMRETELILSALPSGNSIGGACWKIEYNKQTIVYAVELNDKPLHITIPMKFEDFKNANILITNAFLTPKSFKSNQKIQQAPKIYQFLSEEKLKIKLEKVIADNMGQILIPVTDKNRILQCLIMLENMFQTNSKLQSVFKNPQNQLMTMPIVYLEYMSRDTLGVGRSHLGWMNFQDNKVFQDIDENPINFQFVKDIFTLDEYRKLEHSPRIIVTSLASFSQGYTKQLIYEFSQVPKNEIVFLQTSSPQVFKDSLAYNLLRGQKEITMKDSSVIGILNGDDQQDIHTNSYNNKLILDRAESFQMSSDHTLNLQASQNASMFLSQIESNQVATDQNKMTFAQNQLLQSRENFMNKLNEKQFLKNFLPGSYPVFSLNPVDFQKPITFYGEENVVVTNDIEMNEEVAEVQQAFNNMINEGKQIQTVNRFKELQKKYGMQFLYHTQENSFQIRCKISYIPFEARIDKTSFELLMRQVQPKELILINSSKKKFQKLDEFINMSQIQCNIHYSGLSFQTSHIIDENKAISFCTNAAVKQVFIDDRLYKSLPIQRVHQRYEISRIKAALELPQNTDSNSLQNALVSGSTFDLLKEIPMITETEKVREQFQRKNLFFRSKDYKLSHLQKYLETQNIPTVIVDKCLNYHDQVFIYFDKDSGQIRLEGMISKDYFVIRQLIYHHFGRI